MLQLREKASEAWPRAGNDGPGIGEALLIGLAAVLLRGAVFAVISGLHHLSLEQFASLYDGRSYLITAAEILRLNRDVSFYETRVFPGFPAMVALLHLAGVPLAVAALGLNWISAGLVATFSALLFRDRRIGWATALLIPHYLMNSSMSMTEAPMLALTMGAMLLATRKRTALAGASLGLAGLVRPTACFGGLGMLSMLAWRGRWGKAVLAGALAGAVVLGGAALVYLWRGDALANVKFYANDPAAYDDEMLTWPFLSLIRTPIRQHVPPWRVAYIWGHVVLALAACGALLRRTRFGSSMLSRQRPADDERDVLSLPWLLGNTLFALCIGHVWGFECFHRFTVPALPAMFWAIHGILPHRIWAWTAIGAMSMAVAVLSVGG